MRLIVIDEKLESARNGAMRVLPKGSNFMQACFAKVKPYIEDANSWRKPPHFIKRYQV